jgi:precorrin-3B methylase
VNIRARTAKPPRHVLPIFFSERMPACPHECQKARANADAGRYIVAMAGPGQILLVDDGEDLRHAMASLLVRKAKGEHALPVVIFPSIEALLAAIAQIDRAMPLSQPPARGIRV